MIKHRQDGWSVGCSSVLGIAAVIGAVIGLTACGSSYSEAHNYNAPPPTGRFNTRPQWWRVDTPGSYPTLIRTCDGTVGVWLEQDSLVPVIVQNDPACR